MLLSQVYRNATNAFEDDPQLRELLMSTFNKSEEPFSVENLVQQPVLKNAQPTYMGGADNNANPWQTSIEQSPGGQAPMSMAAQPNRAAKTGQELTAQSAPITPEYLAQIDMMSRGQQPGGQQPGSAPPGRAQPPGRPMAPQAPGQSPGQQANVPELPGQSSIAAFLSGLGSSNALLPAIGGGMQAVQDLKSQQASRNHTLRALINRGLDPDTAVAAVTNPEIMKQILPRLFGGQFGGKVSLGKITGEDGREQSIFYDEYGNAQPIGGAKPSAYESGLQKQSLDTIKGYREAANEAETSLAQLGQLRRARKLVDYEGMPFADAWARVMGWYGEGGGEDIRSTAANIQLQFTKLTKGAISDREMALFALATPGLSMGDAGAERVITAMEAASKRTIERNKFFQQWAKLNNGVLTGADDAWSRYVSDNEIISQDAQGNLSVNDRNIQNWTGYLGQSSGESPTGRGQQSQYTPASYESSQQNQPQPQAGGAQNQQGMTPHDFGEARPGMFQDAQGDWWSPNPQTGQNERWEPPR